MAAKKSTAKKSTKKSATKKSSTKKAPAAKKSTAKTTKAPAKAERKTGEVPASVIKTAVSMRKKGEGWPAIREATGYRASVLRPLVRDVDSSLAPAKGEAGSAGRKPKAEGGTKAKTSKKKGGGKAAASDKDAKAHRRETRKSRKAVKAGTLPDLNEMENEEIVEYLEGKKVTFKKHEDSTKKPRTFIINKVKPQKDSKKFGRVIQLNAGTEGTYTVPLTWILKAVEM